MSFESDFKTMANTTVTVYNLSTRDTYGAPVYTTGTSYGARVYEINKMERDPAGQDILLTHRVWLLSSKGGQSDITAESSVVISGSTGKLRIYSVERPPDEDGLHHTVLNLSGYASR